MRRPIAPTQGLNQRPALQRRALVALALTGILAPVLTGVVMMLAVIIPAQQRGIDINGIWQSSIGRTYIIKSSGDRFKWSVQETNETAEGRLEGGILFATWGVGRTEQSVRGRVVETDERGRAIRIEWSNGVVFTRSFEERRDRPIERMQE